MTGTTRNGAALAALILLGTAGAPVAARADLEDERVRAQVGTASWYGPRFHGRQTASGDRFDQNAMTAAHKKLPLGTIARVTNLTNGRQVIVEINDRGPYAGRRVIDLSRAAARELEMTGQGLAKVRIDVVRTPADEDDDDYAAGMSVPTF